MQNLNQSQLMFAKSLEGLKSKADQYFQSQQYRSARICYEEVLREFEKLYGENNCQVALILTQLGISYINLGKTQKAITFLERALLIHNEYYDNEDLPNVALALGNLALAYGTLDNVEKKITLLLQTLSIHKKCYDKKHPNVAITYGNLGIAYGDIGNVKEQKKFLERAYLILKTHYEKDSTQVSLQYALVLAELSKVYRGNALKQKQLLERALVILKNHYQGKDHFYVTLIMRRLGNILSNPQEQKKFFRLALCMFERLCDNDDYVAVTSIDLGNTYGILGDMKNQAKYLQRALLIFERKYPSKKNSIEYIKKKLEEIEKFSETTNDQKLNPIKLKDLTLNIKRENNLVEGTTNEKFDNAKQNKVGKISPRSYRFYRKNHAANHDDLSKIDKTTQKNYKVVTFQDQIFSDNQTSPFSTTEKNELNIIDAINQVKNQEKNGNTQIVRDEKMSANLHKTINSSFFNTQTKTIYPNIYDENHIMKAEENDQNSLEADVAESLSR